MSVWVVNPSPTRLPGHMFQDMVEMPLEASFDLFCGMTVTIYRRVAVLPFAREQIYGRAHPYSYLPSS